MWSDWNETNTRTSVGSMFSFSKIIMFDCQKKKVLHQFIFFLNFYRKETPIENAILCTTSEAPSASGYESPPPSKRNLDKPPPLHRNKKYKKRAKDYGTASSSSEDDFEPDNKSYNLRRLATEASQSQSQSSNVINQSSKTSGRQEGRLLRKRIVEDVKTADFPEDRSSSPMKRSKKMLDSLQGTPRASSSSSGYACCSSDQSDFSKPYSELKYLESIGSIRTIRRAKHPGINKVPSTKAITATPFVSPESQNGWDRKTKLKISYRTGLLKKDDIQFALIIYEPLTMVTRRNLLDEFEKAAEEEKHRTKPKALFASPLDALQSPNHSVTLKTPTIRTKPKNEKVSSLRRLRF